MRPVLICLSGLILLSGHFASAETSTPHAESDIAFGDDRSAWAKDGQCDDRRFTGTAMASSVLVDEDILHDATDCRTAFMAGDLTLRADADSDTALNYPIVFDGIEFGLDDSFFAKDGECDDPRFDGEGMTNVFLPSGNIKSDATDCLEAYRSDQIKLASDDKSASSTIENGAVDKIRSGTISDGGSLSLSKQP